MKNRMYFVMAVMLLVAFVTTFNYGGCGKGGGISISETENNTSTLVGKNFLNALSKGDIKNAYQLTGKAFRYVISESDFVSIFNVFKDESIIKGENVDTKETEKYFAGIKRIFNIIYIDAEAQINNNRATLLYVQKTNLFDIIPINQINQRSPEEREKFYKGCISEEKNKLAEFKKSKTINEKIIKLLESSLEEAQQKNIPLITDVIYLQIRQDGKTGRWEVFPNFYLVQPRQTSQDLNVKEGGGEANYDFAFRSNLERYGKEIDSIKYYHLRFFITNPGSCSKCKELFFSNWNFCPKCGLKVQSSRETELEGEDPH
ncbi:MAG: hypothetical protein V1709_05570 [Planctomycetota bacterium]